MLNFFCSYRLGANQRSIKSVYCSMHPEVLGDSLGGINMYVNILSSLYILLDTLALMCICNELTVYYHKLVYSCFYLEK